MGWAVVTSRFNANHGKDGSNKKETDEIVDVI